MKKTFLRIISTAIAGVFLMSQNPIIYALTTEFFNNLSISDTALTDAEVLGEVKEKRCEFTKHFRMSDGTMKAVTYSDAVHYKDGDEFKEIDNSLISDENNTYKNTNSPFKVNFSKNFKNKGLIKINSDDQEVSISYIKKKYKEFDTEVLKDEKEKSNLSSLENSSELESTITKENQDTCKDEKPTSVENKIITKPLTEEMLNSIPEIEPNTSAVQIENLKDSQSRARNSSEDKTNIDQIYSKAKYENSDDDIDLNYTVSGLSLKENIVLKKRLSDNDRFDFEIKTTLNLSKDNNGDLNFKNPDGKTVFVMPKGSMWDANESYSDKIDYEITPISGGYIVSIIPNRDWLESMERIYPIIIDPSIITNVNTGITDIQYSTLEPNVNYNNVNHISAGCLSETNKWFGCIQCGNLPKLLHGEIITKSILKLMPFPGSNIWNEGPNAYHVSPNNYIGLRNLLSPWNQSVCWNTRPSNEEICQDYVATSASTINDWNCWDITKSTKQWYALDVPNFNYGLGLYSLNESLESVIRYISTKNSDYPNYKPRFEISYKEFIGEENYWSYTSHGAGYKGTGRVNNYAGTLSVSENILSYSGSRNPVSIENTYNNVNYNENANTYIHNKTFIGGYPYSSYTGYGFRLSFNRVVYPLAVDDSLYSQGWRYVYVDGDGTQHYFKLDGDKCIDEDGLNLTLTENNGKIEIKDLRDNKLVFFKPNINDEVYVLKSDSDNNGNIIDYNYSNYYKIINITDASGRITTINYLDETNTVSEIILSDGKKVIFNYDRNKLKEIIYPGDMKTEYKYDNHGRLSIVSTNQGSGRSIKYEYASNDRDSSNFFKVRSVTEYGSQNDDLKAKGRSTEFWYDLNQTKITHKINNLDVPYHESSEIWQFDDQGRTTDIIDENGNFYETEYFKKSEETPKTKHRIKETSSGQKIVHNLLKNSYAKTNDLNGWNVENWDPNHTSFENCCKIAASNEQSNLGNSSFKVSGSENHESWIVAKQIIPIAASNHDRKYTFSGDVKINGNLSGGDGAFLHIGAFKDSVQTAGDEYSKYIHSTDNEWKKLSVTINVPAGSNYIRCYFGMKNSSGDAYFDCLQLEEGDVANEYNMIECSDFKGNSEAWNLSTLDSLTDGITKDGIKIKGNVSLPKNISQKIIVNKKNPTFNIAIKAQAQSIPKTEMQGTNLEKSGFFASLEIKYLGEETTRKVDGYFNQSIYDDQYYFNSIPSQEYISSDLNQNDKIVEYINLFICYNYNCNDAYIKEAQVTVEENLNSYHYNENGSPDSIKDKFGNSTKAEYTVSEEVKKVTRNVNETETESIENTYDNNDLGHNLKSQVSEFANNKKSKNEYTYDDFGNVEISSISAADTESKKIQSSNTYSDSKNYIKTIKDSKDKVTTYNHDENSGNLNSVINAKNSSVNYSYDNADRLIEETCSNSQNQYLYFNGILAEISHKVSDGAKTTYKFIRDMFGNIVETKVGDKTLSKSTYDAGDGLLRQIKYGNEQTINYDYDEKGRLIKKFFGFEKGNKFGEIIYTYDSKNRLIRIYDSSTNVTTNIEYDSFGRFIGMERSDGAKSDVNYDKFRNKIKKSILNFFGITQVIENTFGKGDSILSTNIKSGETELNVKNNYDEMERIESREVINKDESEGIKHEIKYEDYDETRTTGLISGVEIKKKVAGEWTSLGEKFTYVYDDIGNIIEVKDKNDNLVAKYEYDELNQLEREDNAQRGQSIKYRYDDGGNIKEKKIYAYTTDSDLSQIESERTVIYSYDDEKWPDKLTSYDGQEIIYDAIGNPLGYKGWEFEWIRGRRLDKATNSNYNILYKYDENGIRTEKIVNDVSTEFMTSGIKILGQKTGNKVLTWQIDGNGNTVGFKYDGTQYLYLKNAQSDIVGIADVSGNILAKYTYDCWGKLISITDENDTDRTTDTNFIGYINPLRYREYYYDSETGLYYLNARYYDPETGRFINADETLNGGFNLFNYCDNNPIMFKDCTGNNPVIAGLGIGGAVIGGTVGGVVAYNTGKNVWAGIGIGAGAGALIGVSAGVAATAILSGKVALSSSVVASLLPQADRIGSALRKTDIYHRSASFLSYSQLKAGKTFIINGSDGLKYILLQTHGKLNGKFGVFEYIINKSGQVTHQLFKVGGMINGKPN